LKQEEKLTVRCSRDGGVEALEVHGMIMLRVKSEDYGRVIVVIDNKESRNIQLQVRGEMIPANYEVNMNQ
jgi:coatomer subunit delta